MSRDELTKRVELHPIGAKLASAILMELWDAPSADQFYSSIAARFKQETGCDYLAVVQPQLGRWVTVWSSGNRSMPEHLLGDVLDSRTALAFPPWTASPLDQDFRSEELLVLRHGSLNDGELVEIAEALSAILSIGLLLLRRSRSQKRELDRSKTMVELFLTGQTSDEPSKWLPILAHACNRLFGAKDAKVLIWNSASNTIFKSHRGGFDSRGLRVSEDSEFRRVVLNRKSPWRPGPPLSAKQKSRLSALNNYCGVQKGNVVYLPLCTRETIVLGSLALIGLGQGALASQERAFAGEFCVNVAETIQSWALTKQLTSPSTVGEGMSFQLIGQCDAIQRLRRQVAKVSGTDLAVLIQGENGSGKEVVARLIHATSFRRAKPFIAVNCAALSPMLLESELFGHEKGAFTDAHQSRPGRFELANGGCIFLDEIADLSLSGQAKLLRVLEETVVLRVGGIEPITTDLRIIAATNRDLAELVRKGEFREDLFFRLNSVLLELPPLRQRGHDIVELADHFLSRFASDAGRKVPRLTPATRKRMLQYSWPGNVRQLRNVMQRLAFLVDEERIGPEQLNPLLVAQGEETELNSVRTLTDATRDFQINHIRSTIEHARGNMSEAARMLGLHRSNLYRKMQQLDMLPMK